jgi:preprotein translocase subunit YajC
MLMRMLIAATTTPTTTTAAHASSSSRFVFPIIILALAAMWLVVIRPQRRKQKLAQGMQSELAIGDEILTAGGLYGKVTRIEDDEVRVEIAPKVEVRLARRAIAAQLTEPVSTAATATAEPEDASDERWQSAFDAEPDDEKPG